MRDGDTVARLGGDEFVLILNDQTSEDVIFRAMQRIIGKVSEPDRDRRRRSSYVTCSAGISLYPQDGPDVDTLLKNADAAMYRAKEHGPQQLPVLHRGDERARERAPRAREQPAPRARARRVAAALPAASTSRTGAIVGAEALLRWQHPERGLVLPDALHPARRGDRPDRADRRVGAARGLPRRTRAWQRRRPRTRCSRRSTCRRASSARTAWCATVAARAARKRGSSRSSLEIELTESMVMHDVDAAIATLQGLKSLGVLAVGRRLRHRLLEPRATSRACRSTR